MQLGRRLVTSTVAMLGVVFAAGGCVPGEKPLHALPRWRLRTPAAGPGLGPARRSALGGRHRRNRRLRSGARRHRPRPRRRLCGVPLLSVSSAGRGVPHGSRTSTPMLSRVLSMTRVSGRSPVVACSKAPPHLPGTTWTAWAPRPPPGTLAAGPARAPGTRAAPEWCSGSSVPPWTTRPWSRVPGAGWSYVALVPRVPINRRLGTSHWR